MLTQAQHTAAGNHESASLGATLKQNLTEKLPAINTHVSESTRLRQNLRALSLLDCLLPQYAFQCDEKQISRCQRQSERLHRSQITD